MIFQGGEQLPIHPHGAFARSGTSPVLKGERAFPISLRSCLSTPTPFGRGTIRKVESNQNGHPTLALRLRHARKASSRRF